MARPTKPKDVKPDDEAGSAETPAAPAAAGGGMDLKFIITIAAIFIAGIGGSAASTYFLAPMAVVPQVLEKMQLASEGGDGEHGGGDGEHGGGHGGSGGHETLGNNLTLEEFTVNLKRDPTLPGNQFLRTKMSLSMSVPKEEYCDPTGGEEHASLPEALHYGPNQRSAQGQIVGAAAGLPTTEDERLIANGGGGGADPYVTCLQAFDKHMEPYTPTLRDIINQALMKRTAGTLASIEGQEALKDEITENANHLMSEHYAVIRVNFSDFIIQH